jgi:hypothetical protein
LRGSKSRLPCKQQEIYRDFFSRRFFLSQVEPAKSRVCKHPLPGLHLPSRACRGSPP